MKDEGRNFLLFAVFAALILFGWQFFASKYLPAANPPATKIEAGKTVAVASSTGPAGPGAASPEKVRDRAQVLREAPRVRIETRSLQGSINLKGGRIDDLVLSKYKETVAKDSPSIRLFSPSGTEHAYFAGFGWSGDGVTTPGADTVFTASAPVLTPAQPVTLAWTNPQGQRFSIRIAVDDRYMFTVRQTVTNPTGAPITVRPYGLVSRAGVSPDPDTWTDHVGPIGVFDHGATYDITFANLQGKEASFIGKNLLGNIGKPGDNYFDSTGGWFGFGDKYWLAALIPDSGAQMHGGFRAAVGDNFQADFALQPKVVPAGKALVTTAKLFAGAKETNTLDGYEDKLNVRHFGKAIDWGWFEVVEKPIFKYLDFLFRVIGNFGVAIIALTLTIRGLLFPIAQRQFASMAKMRAIQPKMKALQERYKDDKVRAQQEVMALYKSEGVNPLAGCLPTFLQIPILYALYKVLLLTIEMRHQPFVLWIRDLSAPDPATILNAFGYLPWHLPPMLAIGIVPVLLGISMYFQFKLNPAPMDEAQKQVFAIMPWVLMFVMAPFAVGLQIYWITSNTLTILQQRLLYARHPELKVAAAK
ncbi:membrane protein insertase YidC [Sphingomonas sp. H39-1-10]|uniref:membrane protein insertase YidC n=1 Tax=Sphingomonas TaxID=13687 RepID=UPI00088D6E12|nr:MULTISPECIES: membrane protein insertase YidC [Sphingomonas]MDF0489150.1 membrane protein insertase YidC [Sphingomonas pollutisoli]SDA21066.1 YidC/Oxa1 family membrane protein insertase [Sphingomonas sp. NFR15]